MRGEGCSPHRPPASSIPHLSPGRHPYSARPWSLGQCCSRTSRATETGSKGRILSEFNLTNGLWGSHSCSDLQIFTLRWNTLTAVTEPRDVTLGKPFILHPSWSPRTTEPQVQWLWTGQGARGQGRGTAHTHLDLLDQRTAWGRGKASCLRYCRWKEAFWDTATHLRKSTPRAAFGGEKLEAWGSSAHWNTDCPRESQVMHLSQSPPHFVPPLLTAHTFSSFFLMLTCLFSLSNLPCHRVHWFFRVHGHS